MCHLRIDATAAFPSVWRVYLAPYGVVNGQNDPCNFFVLLPYPLVPYRVVLPVGEYVFFAFQSVIGRCRLGGEDGRLVFRFLPRSIELVAYHRSLGGKLGEALAFAKKFVQFLHFRKGLCRGKVEKIHLECCQVGIIGAVVGVVRVCDAAFVCRSNSSNKVVRKVFEQFEVEIRGFACGHTGHQPLVKARRVS